MFYVYVLKSRKNQRVYIGFYTENLKERIMKHHQGLVRTTMNWRPLELVYYEAYRSKKDALTREKRLKRFAKGLVVSAVLASPENLIYLGKEKLVLKLKSWTVCVKSRLIVLSVNSTFAFEREILPIKTGKGD